MARHGARRARHGVHCTSDAASKPDIKHSSLLEFPRRLMRDMQSRTQQEHSEKLAAANATIVRNAARALIRNCDTLELMGIGPASSGAESGRERGAAEGGGHGHAAGGHRISALMCFDELHVRRCWLPVGTGYPLLLPGGPCCGVGGWTDDSPLHR